MPTSGTNKDTTPNAAAGLLTTKIKHPKDETEILYLGLHGSKKNQIKQQRFLSWWLGWFGTELVGVLGK